jgi:Asp-tRNA(Asn)/Glu-tRNA(Gln) amidotransferase A subunit family amidase
MLSGVGIETLREADVGFATPERPHWPHRLDPDLRPAPTTEEILAWPVRTRGFSNPGIADYVDAYRSGRTDPSRVAREVLETRGRMDASDPPLRAFIAMNEEDLLAQAEASTARLQAGRPLGPLDGVPVAVKDELDQKPYPTTVGTSFLGRPPAAEDATAVARLRAAGALLIGKTNMHELGIGVTGINPHHGATRNPHDPTRVSGGSSAGSAAAVAAGLCPVSLGADGGGSIRIPASFCGVLGLKPTFGRVSEHGAAPLDWSVAHLGAFAGCARDLALVYALIAGPDPERDPNTLGQPPVRLDADGIAGLRIGIHTSWFDASDPAVRETCHAGVEALREAGARLVEVEVPDPDAIRLCQLVIIVCEMAAARMADRRLLGGAAPVFGTDTRLSFLLARGLGSGDYIQALRLRQVLGLRMRALFEEIDLLVTPSTACVAPPVPLDALATGESNLPLLDRIMRFATAANLFGLPAISVPIGRDPEGLPIGLQLMAGPFEEHLLLRVALALEGRFEGIRPRVHASILGV